jgi:predicted glycosyltransferase
MSKVMSGKKKILIVPLSWGLGHATRLIPVIDAFKKQGAEVLISGGPAQIQILHESFPELRIVKLPYLQIKLNSGRSQLLHLLFQLPGVILYLFREYYALRRLIRKEKPHGIISDNCYALRNRKVPSIIITHQLQIQVPGSIKFMQSFVNAINHKLIRKFDACWIPDLPGSNNLAGQLSEQPSKGIQSRYIGILSRFGILPIKNKAVIPKCGSILFIISGPENQRSHFEDLIYKEVQNLPENTSFKVIRGLPVSGPERKEANWYAHANTLEMYRFISEAETIICRSGYSTIMDLALLGKSAWLIPTPGQSEQEYLAKHLSEKGIFLSESQSRLKLKKILESNKKSNRVESGDIRQASLKLLTKTVKDFLKSLK